MGRTARVGISRQVHSRTFHNPFATGPYASAGGTRGGKSKLLGHKAMLREDQELGEQVLKYFDDPPRSTQNKEMDETDETDDSPQVDVEMQSIPQDDANDWEDVPDNLKADEGFYHALKDLASLGVASTSRAALENIVANTRWTTGTRYSTLLSKHTASGGTLRNRPQTHRHRFTRKRLHQVLWTLQTRTRKLIPLSAYPVVDMAAAGYLGKTPVNPTVGISFKTLELLYRLRQRQPSLSIEAFMKVICDYYSMPYRHYLRSVLGDAFEIYLRILRAVRKMVFSQLGWNTPDWRALNACRACCYKLRDEPELRFSCLYAFDGNNSLKRTLTLGNRSTADNRTFDGDYFLSREYVDQFKDEVSGAGKGPAVQGDLDSSDSEPGEADDTLLGDPTDGAVAEDGIDTCVKNWKANGPDEKKRMWSMFDESGIFMATCRHHMCLWVSDMVRSGELAKYPLAIVNKVLDTHETKTAGAFDIGCAFSSTIKRTSLGPKFQEKEGFLCVNAFHGYSHNYQCQLKFHPSVIEGMGLEDLETMERIFSSTNRLASVTRYMWSYRWRLFIETYLEQWDDEKYANLGVFLLNNIRQALKIIKEEVPAIEDTMCKQNVSHNDLDAWEKEQVQFFENINKETLYDVHAVAYVELLEELRQLDEARHGSDASFRGTISGFYNSSRYNFTFVPQTFDITRNNYEAEFAKTRRLEMQRRQANARYDRVELEVILMEYRLGITPEKRWTTLTPQYITALKYLSERKYRDALDKLQRLITGYKMRTHIAKALQTRCKAIRRAVAQYNEAASHLVPKRDPLDWSVVSKFGFVEEFDLLQDTRNDVRSKPWSRTVIRELIKRHQRVTRAREELERCNVEIRRLHTAIRDESVLFVSVLEVLKTQSSPLYKPVKDFTIYRRRINASLLRRIQQIYDLPGYTGMKGPGTRLRAEASYAGLTKDDVPVEHVDMESGDESDSLSIDDDDELEGDIGGLIQFSQLAL
ncbi:hypothetical protein NM688_g7648 [Phlebia brevispora]|uniref:Uncharacterized protein n=1 Tax=Phlebia brevispora TaxID=194682 RepID=A0ACC1S2S2_9APHY|nr:hypothetical protein NM688_g7648 [Phlebia brevispora]